MELLVSMIEMAYGLPSMPTTWQQLILSMCNRKGSIGTFAREQDRLEVIRISHAARVDPGNDKTLDLELLLNQIGGIFKPDDEAPWDDDILQVALSA